MAVIPPVELEVRWAVPISEHSRSLKNLHAFLIPRREGELVAGRSLCRAHGIWVGRVKGISTDTAPTERRCEECWAAILQLNKPSK